MKRLALALCLAACGAEPPSTPEPLCADLTACDECARRDDCVWCESWRTCNDPHAICAVRITHSDYCPAR